MKSVGHETPDIVKRTYSRPDRKLQLAFEEWLEKGVPEKQGLDHHKLFQAAERAVSNLEASIDEAHGLLIQYQDHLNIDLAGLFLSAIYNQQPDNTIVYDIETKTPLGSIGYKLAKHKTLILNAQSGANTGSHSAGIVITNAPSGNWTGWVSSGIIITNAPSKHRTGYYSSGTTLTNAQSGHSTGGESSGIIITNAPSKHWTGRFSSGILIAKTKPETIGENRAQVLLPEEIQANEQLDEYLEQLCKTTKMLRTIDDVVCFKEEFDPEKLQDKIKALIHAQ